jgi:Tol biopolymer transport system component
VLACVAVLVGSGPAHAAFPGKNGKLAFVSNLGSGPDISVMNADGTGQTNLTNSPTTRESGPAWSPDGTKIAFYSNKDHYPVDCDDVDVPCDYEIYVMNGDGTGLTRLTNTLDDQQTAPTWTPDGTRITFLRVFLNSCTHEGCDQRVVTINADGTGETTQPAGMNPSDPAWSPNGQKLAHVSYNRFTFSGSLYTINADGTGLTWFCCDASGSNPPPGSPDWSPDGTAIVFFYARQVARKNLDGSGFAFLATSAFPKQNLFPAWSPDGIKIAFYSDRDGAGGVYVMNADGTEQTKIANGSLPDWQPLPINSYPRPKGATPVFSFLTVAYEPCASPNRRHAPPLAADSCSPPVQSSDYLTVGTLDANQQRANSSGYVQYDAKPGNLQTPADEADVRLSASITDVRRKDLSDYPGELSMKTARRITDKDNTPAPNAATGAATVQDLPLAATFPCATTTDPAIGSLCSLTTTADTLLPGSVKESMRSIWELSPIQVYDGGADGDADTSTDNTLFMDEGIFVP